MQNIGIHKEQSQKSALLPLESLPERDIFHGERNDQIAV